MTNFSKILGVISALRTKEIKLDETFFLE